VEHEAGLYEATRTNGPMAIAQALELSQILCRRGDFEEAERMLWDVVRFCPAPPDVSLKIHTELANLYIKWGKRAEALTALEKVDELNTTVLRIQNKDSQT
jgi:tetratricopeptide (TPR) repeat protein